jgi:transcriptional regulator NrdR family protein
MKTITLTLEQAKLALLIVERDITMDEFSEPEYRDVQQVTAYMHRAVLRERLTNAIKNVKGK